ncbi:MAG: 4-(cytidine 5'-diphospho)-2-C-methyl-D-erythritol kinase [Firmicutes bacterium]|nr:4-(cytidine 5'-diphospho)-2-C-methyl-D-erythritol kinase [Bacillota bacterium]
MDQITVKGHAKINLTLRILSLRGDGYHEVRSIMQKIDLCDDVVLTDRLDGLITVTCDNPDIPQNPKNGSYNIAARAAELLKQRFAPDRGADIFIRKRIPVAAGLGGGSSDAAACITGLARLWGLDITTEEMLQVGAEIGSDVPFALSPQTAFVHGRGEKVRVITPAPPFWMTLVKPAPSLLAAEAYAEFDNGGGSDGGDERLVLDGIISQDVERMAFGMGNALQGPVERLVPEVGSIIDRLKRFSPLCAIVSGSGPTVVAITRDREHAAEMLSGFEGERGIEHTMVVRSLHGGASI